MAGGEARARYILEQAPGLLGVALELESVTDDPYQVLKPAPDLPERAIARAVDLAGAIYDRIIAGETPALPGRDARAPECPHQEIIALYHELLPLCPRVRTWTPARQAKLRSRWREHPDIDWWKGYFSYVSESLFLTGRAHAKDRRPFTADLEWLITPAHFARIHEGKYHGV
jgi:hypothetical protein